MKIHFQFTGLLVIAALLCTATTFAQDEEAATTLPQETEAEETSPENEAVRAGQEVEINEDNYRQFMELKDPRLQRSMLPENSYQSQAGMQKLDKLPEESQKHLRNQLREIILEGDQWQPGDEETEYPYVPSVAAATNQGLKNQEAEAWGELVDNYHQREAETYSNSSRSRAAAAASGTSNSPGSPGSPGEGADGKEGTDGSGSEQAGEEGQASNQESSSDQAGSAGSYSPNAANDPNATSTEGVSQNAMEFLTGITSGNSNSGASNAGENNTAENNAGASNAGENNADESNTGSEAGSDSMGTAQENAQAGQQDSGEQDATASTSTAQNPDNDPLEESTSGTSQNALQYLTEGSVQGDQPAQHESDTLTIEELLNARGVRGGAGTSPTPGTSTGQDEPTDKDPDKDG